MSKFAPNVIEEITGQQATNRFDLDHTDLTQTTSGTAQTFKVWVPARVGDKILHVELFLDEPFQNTADAAFNDTQVEVGDSGDLDNLIVAIQCNKNGSLGTFPARDTGDGLPYTVPASPLEIDVTVLSQSAKSLSNCNKGRLHVNFTLLLAKDAAALAATGNENG